MIESAVVSKLMDLANRVREIVVGKSTVTSLEGAFDLPEIAGLRDAILKLVSDDGSIDDLIRTSQALGAEFDRLESEPLTSEIVDRLQAVSGARYALSLLAAERASEPLQIFRYTLTTVAPYIEAAAQLGIIALSAAA